MLVATSGPAGDATFTYDGAGRMSARTDTTGTATFTWTDRGELDVMVDPLSGRTLDHDWDPAGQLDRVLHDDGTVQQFAFDDRGLLASEAWSDFAGEVYAEEYLYDPAGNPTGRQVRRRDTAPQVHTYSYDLAGRLTGWTDPLDTTVVYAWDANTNRTSDGAGSWVYDERNRLVSGPDGTYSWTDRGTLASLAGPAGTATWQFDPLGRATAHTPAGTSTPVTFTYDALDRIATRDTDAFGYTGPALDPTSDGTGLFSRTPAGHLVATLDPSTGATRTITDRHGDVVGAVDATGNVIGVRSYTPFGQVATSDGTVATAAGFQGDWTDPTSGEVWQGARWYQPAWATFTSRDTVFGELATPMSLNRFTYAFGSPLRFFDPDGRYGFDGGYTGSKATYSTYRRDTTNLQRARTRTATYRKVSTSRTLSHEFQTVRAAKARVTVARTRATPKTARAAPPRRATVARTARTNSVRAAPPSVSRRVAAQPRTSSSSSALRTAARHTGGFFTGIGGGLKDSAIGLWDTGQALSSCQRDPAGCARNVAGFARTVADDPVGVGSAMWAAVHDPVSSSWRRGEYGYAVGRVAAGVAEVVAGSKGLTHLGRASRVATTATRASNRLNVPRRTPVSCTANSFVAGTLVLAGDGARVPIEDVEIGDTVWATDPETGTAGPREVTATIEGDGLKELVDIEVDGQVVTATDGHPMWDPGQRQWIDAADLQPGDLLAGADGTVVAIDNVDDHTAVTRVYNLTVDDIHTYHVAVGPTDILVHNCNASEAIRPWRVGDPIDAVTGAGNNPAWSTVRGRHWKNEAAEAVDGEYSVANLERMRRGLAPFNPDYGVSMELDHIVPRRLGGGNNIENLRPLWPWEHADLDEFRFYTGPRP